MRIALIAEGPGELVGPCRGYPTPGQKFEEDQLGPGHRLARRALCWQKPQIAATALSFVGPLRLGTRVPSGNMLHGTRNLERLVAWPTPKEKPDLFIILVDRDRDPARLELRDWANTRAKNDVVVGVAVEEFEAWLIADPKAVSSASKSAFMQPPTPESMKPAEAKERLTAHLSLLSDDERRIVRCNIADTFDCDVVARSCGAFSEFAKRLAVAAGG